MIPAWRQQQAVVVILLSFAIVSPLQSSSPTITFHVQDFTTAQAIEGATVSLTGGQSVAQETGADGAVALSIQFGEYEIIVGKSQCSQIGPQSFIVDETAPSQIIVKLQCPPSGSPPLESPTLQTDKTTYSQREVLSWQSAGFAPGALVQPCLANICGGVAQSDSAGSANGVFVIDIQLAGAQTFSVTNTNTATSAQVQITISS
jgi:hypothetical protein